MCVRLDFVFCKQYTGRFIAIRYLVYKVNMQSETKQPAQIIVLIQTATKIMVAVNAEEGDKDHQGTAARTTNPNDHAQELESVCKHLQLHIRQFLRLRYPTLSNPFHWRTLYNTRGTDCFLRRALCRMIRALLGFYRG